MCGLLNAGYAAKNPVYTSQIDDSLCGESYDELNDSHRRGSYDKLTQVRTYYASLYVRVSNLAILYLSI